MAGYNSIRLRGIIKRIRRDKDNMEQERNTTKDL